MNQDFLDMLRALLDAEARFIIVGAYARNIYLPPRATGDLDIWVEPTRENAAKVLRALNDFGAPTTEITEADFAQPGVTFQVGVPPVRIDLLTELSGIEFSEAWQDCTNHSFGPYSVPFLGKTSLIRNKRASGRPKDLVDLQELENL